MEQTNKNNKLFTAIRTTLILLIFSTQIVFIWANNPVLKVRLTFVAGFFLLIFAVFSVFFWLRRRNDPLKPKETKLQRVLYMLFALWYVMVSTFSFIQNHALRWEITIIEGSFTLIICVLVVYAWRRSKVEKKDNP